MIGSAFLMGFFKGEVVNLPLTSSLRFFQESLGFPQLPPYPQGHLELLRLQALLQQGEGCAAFGNAAFLEAAVEAAAAVGSLRLPWLVGSGGEQTQLGKRFPSHQKKVKVRDKLLKLHQDFFFSQNVASRLGLILVTIRVICMTTSCPS